MIKVLFICHGNICRSCMAEFIFKDMVNKRNISDMFYIDSKATSNEEIGNDMYYLAKRKLDKEGIKYTKREAKRITKDDYNYYDYLIVMDDNNKYNTSIIVGNDYNNKIHKLLEYANINRDISDPWYTNNFDECYNDLVQGLNSFLKYLGY